MRRITLLAAVLIGGFSLETHGLGDTDPRAMGLAQSYTALARGPAAVFWNPANLALKGSPGFSWYFLGAGTSFIVENNSFSVKTYNDNFTRSDHFLTDKDKKDLLNDVPGEGLKLNLDIDPNLSLLVPVNGGVAFQMPRGISSAVSIGFTSGLEGEIPKDMFELLLFGNEFEQQRLAQGKDGDYDIAEWEGSRWMVASLNWACAKSWMPGRLDPYLSEFSVGGTIKVTTGVYGEIMRSSGSFVSRIQGAELDAYLITRNAGKTGFGIDLAAPGDSRNGQPAFSLGLPDLGGTGIGLDLGVAGVTRDRKLVFSVGLLNLLDVFSWSRDASQDSLYAEAADLRVTRVLDVDHIEEILENDDVDGDGDIDFLQKIGDRSFSRSMPALLRVGGSYELSPRLTAVGNWDQAFSRGFGFSTTPRISGGAEYRLVPWFPTRAGLSLGGRGHSAAIGFAFGPFKFSRLRANLFDLALVTRGGLLAGISKGTAISLQLFRLDMV